MLLAVKPLILCPDWSICSCWPIFVNLNNNYRNMMNNPSIDFALQFVAGSDDTVCGVLT